jgi:hypothetical protein
LFPSRRTEIINLLRHKPFLGLLGTSEPDQQQALLETATAEQVHCLCLCAENAMKRKYLMPKYVIKKLRPYKHEMLRLANTVEENVEEEENGYSFNMVKVSLDYY